MAITVKWYGSGMLNCLQNNIDLEADTIKMSLHTATYTPNRDTNDFHNDATNELSAANGYTAGGETLASKVLSYDATSDEVRLDCADIVFLFTASQTFRYGVIYKDRGGANTADELIALVDFGADQTVSTTYTLVVDATGLLYVDTT